jgi:hypothetical protein
MMKKKEVSFSAPIGSAGACVRFWQQGLCCTGRWLSLHDGRRNCGCCTNFELEGGLDWAVLLLLRCAL